jgi:ATP-dependent DNA ligase
MLFAMARQRGNQADPHGGIANLQLTICEKDGLRYVGPVGTGFTDAMRRDLRKRLEALTQSQPRL